MVIEKQKDYQRYVDFPIDTLREAERNELSEKYIFKAIEELIELRKEFPSMINPWSKHQKNSDTDRIREEFSDVMLFLINFSIVWKLTPTQVLESLEKTQNTNCDNLKVKKLAQLTQETLSIPSYTTGVGSGHFNPTHVFVGQNPSSTMPHGYKFWSDPNEGSAKVLLPILETKGLRKTSYFTNVVKSTTPNNRVPTKDETEFWKEYLFRELDILRINNPNMKVIPMGTYASQELPHYKAIKHPASVQYGTISLEDYSQELEKVL